MTRAPSAIDAVPGSRGDSAPPNVGLGEFVTLMAALMAINSLGMDLMLAALPQMGESLRILTENDRQWIIAAYMLSFGAGQLFYGPIADRYGRKPVLIVSLTIFAATSVLAALATTFQTMLIARVLQGFCVASSRVLNVSMIRDCYSGRRMARVMSLTFIVFAATPILAPGLGQLILLMAPWPAIFMILAGLGALLTGWIALRLSETLRPEHRRSIQPAAIASAMREVVTCRTSIGYTISFTMLFGATMGYVNSAQQLFDRVFAVPHLFGIVFAGIAGFTALSALLNSRIVERFGTRVISHTALLGLVGISGLHLLIVLAGRETLASFAVLQGLVVFCSTMAGPNFAAMAMQPMGHIAGTAASVQGFITIAGAAAIGIAISQSFDGTALAVVAGFLLMSVAALIVVLITEQGRLFQPHTPPLHAS